MKTLLVTLVLSIFTSPAMALDCDGQVAKIFANLISVQENVAVSAEQIEIGHLTKYEWVIRTILPSGKYIEFLADVDNDINCNITSMIESDAEAPAYDRHWKKQN